MITQMMPGSDTINHLRATIPLQKEKEKQK